MLPSTEGKRAPDGTKPSITAVQIVGMTLLNLPYKKVVVKKQPTMQLVGKRTLSDERTMPTIEYQQLSALLVGDSAVISVRKMVDTGDAKAI